MPAWRPAVAVCSISANWVPSGSARSSTRTSVGTIGVTSPTTRRPWALVFPTNLPPTLTGTPAWPGTSTTAKDSAGPRNVTPWRSR
ncbi:hypothetical protein G6F22_022019 [Rhizopus arrhizus]|nr:hypothetical protein G6F22_022019 [Rhizopus arrhizus]KAG1222126.1 hypothetical protein G6F68_020732 [Rhizopus microsporus]